MEWLGKRKAARFTKPPPMRPVSSEVPPEPLKDPVDGLETGSYFECEFARPADPRSAARTDTEHGDVDAVLPAARAAYLQLPPPPPLR